MWEGDTDGAGLSHIALQWMLSKAVPLGLTLKPGAMQEVQANANAHGRLYNERNGLGVFYRYYPRHITDLCREKILSSTSINIHQSVFDRMACFSGNYAPGHLPDTFSVVSEDRPAKPIAIKSSQWEVQQQQLKKWTKWRSYLYGVFLDVSLLVVGVALWLWGWAPVSVQKADISRESIGAVFHYLAKTLKYILPGMFENLINLVVVQQPLLLLFAVVVVSGLLWLRGWVRKQYGDVCYAFRTIFRQSLTWEGPPLLSTISQLKSPVRRM